MHEKEWTSYGLYNAMPAEIASPAIRYSPRGRITLASVKDGGDGPCHRRSPLGTRPSTLHQRGFTSQSQSLLEITSQPEFAYASASPLTHGACMSRLHFSSKQSAQFAGITRARVAKRSLKNHSNDLHSCQFWEKQLLLNR